MFPRSPVCYVRRLFLFKHITEQNTDDSISHTRLRGPTVIPMQISAPPINAGLQIPTGAGLRKANTISPAAGKKKKKSAQ